MPGDVQGRVPAEVVFHQGQREVDAGGDARRRGDLPSRTKIGSASTLTWGYLSAREAR